MLSSDSRIGYSNNVPRTLRCMRAHFEIPATGGAPAMTDYVIDFDGEVSTAVKAIDNEQRVIDHVYYDLAGRRVAQPTKGLYIFNGKKSDDTMNRKKYVPPYIRVVHRVRMPLLQVTSVQSNKVVNWYILGFDEVDKDR